MKKVPTLHHIEFTTDERLLLCSIINHFGDGGHPVADDQTIDGFMVSYIVDILNKKEFLDSMHNLSPKGEEVLKNIAAKL